jgi:soluble lytic murein transglycosylase
VKWWRLGLILLLVGAGVGFFYLRWEENLERSQDRPILAAAQRYGLDPALVKAVVWRESRFYPGVRGKVGSSG